MSTTVGRGLRLVPKRSKRKFRVAETIPITGIYEVVHLAHRASHQATLLKGEKFPPCNKCGDEVSFELVREVFVINDDFKVRLYQIPHPKEEEQAEEETA